MWSEFSEAFNQLIEKLTSWLDQAVLALPNIVVALIVGIITYFASKWVFKLARRSISRASDKENIINIGANAITVVFVALMLFLILGILNLDQALTALLGTAGVAGLAVGLALQDPLMNVFSGFMLSVRGLYNVGDWVATNGYEGAIEEVTLRTTILRDALGLTVSIPNKMVIQNPLVNYSLAGKRKVAISTGVAYGDDLTKVEHIVREAINDCVPEVTYEDIDFFFTEFGDSSINFTVRYWINRHQRLDFLHSRSKGIIALKSALDQNGFTIPFPIRTLDFGVVGGTKINEMYPLQAMRSNGKSTATAETPEQN